MPRVRVIADDGWVALDEHACPSQFDSEHHRHCLAERIRWAVEDAAAREAAAAAAPRLRAAPEPQAMAVA